MTNRLLALSLLSLATACTTSSDDADRVSTSPEAPPTATTELAPVATFTSISGSTIEVYAVGAHGYFATELADVGVGRVLSNLDDIARMTTSELYQALTG